MSLRAFLAYSKVSEQSQRECQEEAFRRVESKLQEHGIAVADWVEVQGLESISGKVEQSIAQSDAMVADITGANPNVLYEIGVARARGIPVLLILMAGSVEAGRIADLGDREFLLFPSLTKEGDPAAWVEYSDKLTAKVKNLRCRLPHGAVELRREKTRMHADLESTICHHLPSDIDLLDPPAIVDPPLLRVLSGWVHQLRQDLGNELPKAVQLDADYYPACFRRFEQHDRTTAHAVADLSWGQEGIWASRTSHPEMAVGERIFLIPGEWFFADERLRQVFDTLRIHADSRTEVRFGQAEIPRLPPHVFENASPSKDILVIGDDVVAGYVRELEGNRTYLRIVTDKSAHKHASKYYQSIRAHTVKFDRGWARHAEMRAAWLAKSNIGEWRASWTSSDRDEHYYDNYDLHIRCWVPGYEDLLDHTAKLIMDALERRASAPESAPIRVLEAGIGTGALTLRVMKHIAKSTKMAAFSPGTTYLAIDKSERMLEKARAILANAAVSFVNLVLERRVVFSDLPSRTDKFDIVCGSLVLNHFAGSNTDAIERALADQLAGARSCLADDGVVLLADSIVPNVDEAGGFRERWSNQMRRIGLGPRQLRAFFEGNKVMLAITEDIVRRAAATAGFAVPGFEKPLVPGSSAFRIVSLRLR